MCGAACQIWQLLKCTYTLLQQLDCWKFIPNMSTTAHIWRGLW
jgi:hypothetical protein